MFASPAKRRRTSPTTSVAVDASNTQSNPSTPKRASFQSPTKASLARSHPDLLQQSAGRSQVQTRGQGLRQELLSRRTSQSAPKPATAGPQTQKEGNEPRGNKPVNDAAIDGDSFSGAVRNLFTTEPSRSQVSSRTPLRTRQPHSRLAESQTKKGDLHVSKQAQPNRSRGRPQSNKDVENDEPELPPTPVQLGLNLQPDRPRGLSSSSPGRSSGSSRQRTRLNEPQRTSSPSKVRVQPQIAADSINPSPPPAPTGARAEEIPDEAPESDAETPADDEEPSVPVAVLRKRYLRDSLSAQLARLQSEMASLETALAGSEKNNSSSDDAAPSLLALLTTPNPSCGEVTAEEDNVRPSSPPVPNPTALGPKPLPHLTLFAPGNLQLQSKTSTSVLNGKAHQIHVLELLAPEPWPAHIFGATIRVTVDVEMKQVQGVELQNLRPSLGHQGLTEWVKKRLAGSSGLHRYDAGGLVWGIGRWWEECVARALEWRRLEERFNHKTSKKNKTTQEDVEVVTHEDVKTLLPHLARTSMEFELGETKRVTRSRKEEADPKPALTKVMLIWDLCLDWTGEVDEAVGVAVAGLGGTGEQGVKEVFGKIFRRDGVFRAMEGILEVLGKGTGVAGGS